MPAPGHDPGQFFDPEGIAIDGQGNVYVSEVNNNRVQKLTRDGKSTAVFGGPQSDALVQRHFTASERRNVEHEVGVCA